MFCDTFSEDRETHYQAYLWIPAAPNLQVPYYAVFSIVSESVSLQVINVYFTMQTDLIMQ